MWQSWFTMRYGKLSFFILNSNFNKNLPWMIENLKWMQMDSTFPPFHKILAISCRLSKTAQRNSSWKGLSKSGTWNSSDVNNSFSTVSKKNKKTEKWTFEAFLICLSSNFHATQLKLLVYISKHYSRQFARKTNFNSNWMCLDNKKLKPNIKV